MSEPLAPRYAVIRDGSAVRIVFHPGDEARAVCAREIEAEIRRVMEDRVGDSR